MTQEGIKHHNPLTQERIAAVNEMKGLEEKVLAFIEDQMKKPDQDNIRSLCIAITQMEDCAMWAIKGITNPRAVKNSPNC